MASTDDDGTPDGGGSEGGVSRLMSFLTEPLGMGLVAGIAISLGLGYYIL
jgi:hypothetical protein